MAKISIVTPTYNSEAYVAQTIQSVQAQTHSDWEYHLVDDGSTDGTREVIAQFAAQDNRIRLITQENSGVAAARNRGSAASDPAAQHVAFLDNDDVWRPETLETLAMALADQPSAVAAYGPGQFIDDQGAVLDAGKMEAWTLQRCGVRGTRVTDWPCEEPTTFAVLVTGNCIATPGQALIRKSALEAAGPFDVSAPPCDDWDMWLRLSRLGEIILVPQTVIGWRQHTANASRQRKGMANGEHYLWNKLAASKENSEEQLRLLKIGRRYWHGGRKDLRIKWMRECLAQRQYLEAAKQLRHAVGSFVQSL